MAGAWPRCPLYMLAVGCTAAPADEEWKCEGLRFTRDLPFGKRVLASVLNMRPSLKDEPDVTAATPLVTVRVCMGECNLVVVPDSRLDAAREQFGKRGIPEFAAVAPGNVAPVADACILESSMASRHHAVLVHYADGQYESCTHFIHAVLGRLESQQQQQRQAAH